MSNAKPQTAIADDFERGWTARSSAAYRSSVSSV
jgi:hypothetical protein